MKRASFMAHGAGKRLDGERRLLPAPCKENDSPETLALVMIKLVIADRSLAMIHILQMDFCSAQASRTLLRTQHLLLMINAQMVSQVSVEDVVNGVQLFNIIIIDCMFGARSFDPRVCQARRHPAGR